MLLYFDKVFAQLVYPPSLSLVLLLLGWVCPCWCLTWPTYLLGAAYERRVNSWDGLAMFWVLRVGS